MAKTITFQGKPLTLIGRNLKIGAPAPDFKVTSQSLEDVTLQNFAGKIKILTTFPSLDTPVCDLQVKEFNKRATSISQEVAIVGISQDLPFAQKRFCQENDITRISVVSDYKTSSFGINYGVLIKELHLLARTILIVDKNNVVRSIQIVKELTAPPDYEAALQDLETVSKTPALAQPVATPQKCTPCEKGTPPLPLQTIEKLLAQHRGWQLVDDKKLVREFNFGGFSDAKCFLDLVAIIAEEQNHHPTATLSYNKVKVTLTTHTAGGLTENDFIMARIIGELEI